MPSLVIDIETIGNDFEAFDETTKADLTKSIEADPKTPEYKQALAEIKRNLVFSPLTGEIVAIGVLDAEKDKAVVYFQAPGAELTDTEEDSVTYRPMTEKQMLESFWGGVQHYDTFITFNGRSFDAPYIITRSAVHRVAARKDLMGNRYLSRQFSGAQHVDLKDQLGYYGAVRRPGSLHMWCRALGITSPKAGGVAAAEVGGLFAEKQYLDIARYNARDLWATKELYNYWKQYMQPG